MPVRYPLWNGYGNPVGMMLKTGMKLQQGQLWRKGSEFFRIVECERLSVTYKTMENPFSKEGELHEVTKKEFCRLIKEAKLLD